MWCSVNPLDFLDLNKNNLYFEILDPGVPYKNYIVIMSGKKHDRQLGRTVTYMSPAFWAEA